MVLFATDLPLTMLRPYLTTVSCLVMSVGDMSGIAKLTVQPVNLVQMRLLSNHAVSQEEWFEEGLKTKNQWFLVRLLS
jgi:hypothetical protein